MAKIAAAKKVLSPISDTTVIASDLVNPWATEVIFSIEREDDMLSEREN
jgi:hypothetical protein